MNKYTFTVTRDITESTRVTVKADNIGEAHCEAITMDLDGWEVDDNPGQSGIAAGAPYIPDPSDYECQTTDKYTLTLIDHVGDEVAQVATGNDIHATIAEMLKLVCDCCDSHLPTMMTALKELVEELEHSTYELPCRITNPDMDPEYGFDLLLEENKDANDEQCPPTINA
jgi:hypothetical protein